MISTNIHRLEIKYYVFKILIYQTEGIIVINVLECGGVVILLVFFSVPHFLLGK